MAEFKDNRPVVESIGQRSGLSDVTAAVEASSASIRTVLGAQHTATQDDLNAVLAKMELVRVEEAQRFAILLAAVQAIPGQVSALPNVDLFESRVRAGQQVMFNTGLQVVGAAINFRVLVSNPAASGKTVWFDRIIVSQTGTTAATGTMRLGPNLTGTPATALAPLLARNMRLGAAATDSVLLVRTDVNATALAGGVGGAVGMTIPGNSRITLNEDVMVLPPGTDMGINLSLPGATSFVMQLITHQEPV